MKRIFIVTNIDTEGPLYDPNMPEIFSGWKQLDESLAKVFSKEFREKFNDSAGNPVKINWFVLHWTGFKTNPRKRQVGYNTVFDHYCNRWGDEIKSFGDGLYWHYHHPAKSRDGLELGRDWNNNREYYKVLNHCIIDRNFFSPVFRAGGTIEDNDVSNWLEQWIPFDFSSRAKAFEETEFDWSKAPDDWSSYHPSTKDYQSTGEMKRVIARSIDIGGKYYKDENSEILKAFERAKKGQDTILSYFYHDYRDMKNALQPLYEKIWEISKKFPEVEIVNSNALDAIRAVLRIKAGEKLELSLEIKNDQVFVKANHEIFGKQPYLAVKFKNGKYERTEMKPEEENQWSAKLDLDNIKIIGVAANDKQGSSDVKLTRF